MNLTVDHKTIFAASGGREFDPTKPVVVLIHGAGQDRTIWSFQTRFLAHHGYAVLALDLPGHGGSDGRRLNRSERCPIGCPGCLKWSESSLFRSSVIRWVHWSPCNLRLITPDESIEWS